jgi:hypothetical protein
MDNERLVFLREKNGKVVFTVINNSENDMKITLSSVSESLMTNKKAKEFIAKYADSDDFWIVKVDEGTINWNYNETNFDANYVYAISNKDEKTTLDILDDSDLLEIEKLVFLK